MPTAGVEALRQEGVERLAALTSEARDEPLASPIGSEHAGKEFEWRPIPCFLPPLFEPRERCAVGVPVLNRRLQPLPERAPPPGGGQDQQVVIADGLAIVTFHQRTLQKAGQHLIVGGQQHRMTEGEEIHDGNIRRQLEPVGAADRKTLFLQRPHQFIHQGGALADEDENIARTDRSSAP